MNSATFDPFVFILIFLVFSFLFLGGMHCVLVEGYLIESHHLRPFIVMAIIISLSTYSCESFEIFHFDGYNLVIF